MKNNTELLRLIGLPVFRNAKELSILVGIRSKLLLDISLLEDEYFTSFEIPKRTSGKRTIDAPKKDLKAVQAWVLRNILEKVVVSKYATAFIRNKGLLDNVKVHEGNRYFLKIDLVNFFNSIKRNNIESIFDTIGYGSVPAKILTDLVTYKGRLPQGGVTSPALSNIVTTKLDRRIAGYCAKRNISFTRYADDITFSASTPENLNPTLKVVQDIIEHEGFRINKQKIRRMGPSKRCTVTGLVKNNSSDVFGIGRKKADTMRAIMYNFVKKKRVSNEYPTRQSIEGWLSFVKSVDENTYLRMKKYWDNLNS